MLPPSLKNPPKTASYPLLSLLIAIIFYLLLHSLIQVNAGDAFFWAQPSLQWLDWVFWSLFGILLKWSSEVARLRASAQDAYSSWPEILKKLGGILVTLVLLAAVNHREISLAELKLDLSQTPSLGITMAFVFGFYPEISEILFFSILINMIRRTIEKLFGRSLGNPEDDFEYIRLYVNPGLQNAYCKAKEQPHGKAGHIASRDRRVSYQIVNFLSKEGFTVNALKSVYFGRDVLSLSRESLAELIAHEASHVKQNYLSDSIDQEIQAYVTGARVRKGLKKARLKGESETWIKFGNTLCDEQNEYLSKRGHDWEIAHKKAINKVKSKATLAPLYNFIPEKQAEHGLPDVIEAVRQAGFLIGDFLVGKNGNP